jgi:hypothetical protein
MTRPRNDEHPAWCTRKEFRESLTKHRSTEVRVGNAVRPITARGQVSARLTSTLNGPTWLTVNVFIGVGLTADLSLDDAVKLRDGLIGLLQEAGYTDAPSDGS